MLMFINDLFFTCLGFVGCVALATRLDQKFEMEMRAGIFPKPAEEKDALYKNNRLVDTQL